jgi:uncharacterized membrane protein (UPF0136 family)
MSDLESRLRSDIQAAGDAIGIPYADVTAVIRRGRFRKLMTNLAVAATIVVVAAGAWQLTRTRDNVPVMSSTTSTVTTTTQLTEVPIDLTWKQVDAPPIKQVLSVWTTQDGRFAVWSGSEVWTSPDGEAWSLTATTPDQLSSDSSFQPVADVGGGWVGIGGGDTPTAYLSKDGQTWTSVPLPTDGLASDSPLMTSQFKVAFVATSGSQVMIAGSIHERQDEQAFIAALAPDLQGDGYTMKLTQDGAEIYDSSGALVRTVPLEQVRPLLKGTGLFTSTVAWFSLDGGETWTATRLPGNTGEPKSLHVLDGRFVLTTYDSTTGPVNLWESTATGEFQQVATTDLFDSATVWDDQFTTVTGGELAAFGPNWQLQTIGSIPGPSAGDLAGIGALSAGPAGLVAVDYDRASSDASVQSILFTKDGHTWQVTTGDAFGDPGTAQVAVNAERVLMVHGPGQQGGSAPISPFTTWIGTPRSTGMPSEGSTASTTAPPG